MHTSLWSALPEAAIKPAAAAAASQARPVAGKLIQIHSSQADREVDRMTSQAATMGKNAGYTDILQVPTLETKTYDNSCYDLTGSKETNDELVDAFFLPEWFMFNRDRYGDLAPYIQKKLDILSSGKNPFPDFLFSQDWCREVDVADNKSIADFQIRDNSELILPSGNWNDISLDLTVNPPSLPAPRPQNIAAKTQYDIIDSNPAIPHPKTVLAASQQQQQQQQHASSSSSSSLSSSSSTAPTAPVSPPLPGIWAAPELTLGGYADPLWNNAAWPMQCPPPFPGHALPADKPSGDAEVKAEPGVPAKKSTKGKKNSSSSVLDGLVISDKVKATVALLRASLINIQGRYAAAKVSPALVRYTYFILQQKIALYMLRRSLRHIYLTCARASPPLFPAASILSSAASLCRLLNTTSPVRTAVAVHSMQRLGSDSQISASTFNPNLVARLTALSWSALTSRRLMCGWLRSDAMRLLVSTIRLSHQERCRNVYRVLIHALTQVFDSATFGKDSRDVFVSARDELNRGSGQMSQYIHHAHMLPPGFDGSDDDMGSEMDDDDDPRSDPIMRAMFMALAGRGGGGGWRRRW
jgi:hypothetical protein